MHSSINHTNLLAALAGPPRVRGQALMSLPGILAEQGEGHVTVSLVEQDQPRIIASSEPALPEGTQLPAAGVVAACAELCQPLYLPDAAADPRYHSADHRSLPVELALPLLERDTVVAVLNLERDALFTADERRALELFAEGVSERLTERSRSLEATITAELSRRLAEVDTLAEAAAALDVIAPALGAGSGAILSEWQGRLYPLVLQGEEVMPERRAALSQGVPYPEGLSWRACLMGEVQVVSDYADSEHALEELREHLGPVVLVHPISQKEVYRTVLVLHLPAGSELSEADLTMVGCICRHLAIMFNAVRLATLQEQLPELQALIVERDADALYERILETAVKTVPGAEAGSLLVRCKAGEPFRFEAVDDYDLAALQPLELAERQVRAVGTGLAGGAHPTSEWQGG